MGSNILITGAAGYISKEQAKALSTLGINVLQLDLTDEKAVVQSLLRYNINIVIHCASSINADLALNLITALGKQREASREQTFFIHTSGLSAFYEKTGWPQRETKDTGPVFDLEKQLADSFPIRKTDVAVIEHAKAKGVTSFIVIPSTVYGKGSGEWNKLSVVLPVYIQACISQRAVSKFPENTKVSGVHISDLTALYGRIIQKILQKEPLPSGTEGYYFALAHNLIWWEVLDQLAATLKARGLVTTSDTSIWSDDEAAAEAMGIPIQFVQPLWNSGENIVRKKPDMIGWEPAWDKDDFLGSIDDEIQAVLELSKAKSSLIDSLFESAKG
ncbi:NAD(P)-binding protein [Viridothelium virens]|uniref:NAD(P)-binding protein n=1 Tax=Viridothelium virens TaxID=1048519 RepID=A0A6A6H1N8_VIRVR|nr:NAD(P)-binding protein [Viridothelium virens]